MPDNYCTFYIVRHGETEWNVKGLVQGHTDIPLTEKGKKEARQLAKKFSQINFNAVFSSDLLRAKQTAKIITLERNIAIKTTQALRERSFGRFEGRSLWEDKEYQKLIQDFLRLPKEEKFKKSPHPEIESDERLISRFITFIREVAVAYPGGNILVVTHGGVMRAFLLHLGFADEESLPSGSIKNLAYIKLETDGVDFFIKETFGIEKIKK